MSINVTCPGCGKKYHCPDEMAGKRAGCKRCGAAIQIASGPSPASPGRPEADQDSCQGVDLSALETAAAEAGRAKTYQVTPYVPPPVVIDAEVDQPPVRRPMAGRATSSRSSKKSIWKQPMGFGISAGGFFLIYCIRVTIYEIRYWMNRPVDTAPSSMLDRQLARERAPRPGPHPYQWDAPIQRAPLPEAPSPGSRSYGPTPVAPSEAAASRPPSRTTLPARPVASTNRSSDRSVATSRVPRADMNSERLVIQTLRPGGTSLYAIRTVERPDVTVAEPGRWGWSTHTAKGGVERFEIRYGISNGPAKLHLASGVEPFGTITDNVVYAGRAVPKEETIGGISFQCVEGVSIADGRATWVTVWVGWDKPVSLIIRIEADQSEPMTRLLLRGCVRGLRRLPPE